MIVYIFLVKNGFLHDLPLFLDAMHFYAMLKELNYLFYNTFRVILIPNPNATNQKIELPLYYKLVFCSMAKPFLQFAF